MTPAIGCETCNQTLRFESVVAALAAGKDAESVIPIQGLARITAAQWFMASGLLPRPF